MLSPTVRALHIITTAPSCSLFGVGMSGRFGAGVATRTKQGSLFTLKEKKLQVK